MKTLIERRDEWCELKATQLLRAWKNKIEKSQNPTISPKSDAELLRIGFDYSSDIWREETKALVEALENSCKCEYCSGGYGMPMRCVTECIACKTIAAFKAKGLL